MTQRMMKLAMAIRPRPKVKVGFRKGQSVRVTDGPFVEFVGTVDEINMEKGKVRVMGDVEAARKYVPEVRAAGADVVIALIHGRKPPFICPIGNRCCRMKTNHGPSPNMTSGLR